MTTRHDDDPEDESEVLSKRRDVHYHTYNQSKNGNGASALNNALLGLCGTLLLIGVAEVGFMWKGQIDDRKEAAEWRKESGERTARLEAQMVIVLQRLPP